MAKDTTTDAAPASDVQKTVFLIAGPMAGQFLVLPEADAKRGIDAGWAEDPEGKGAFDLQTPVVGEHEDFADYQASLIPDPAPLSWEEEQNVPRRGRKAAAAKKAEPAPEPEPAPPADTGKA